MPARYLSLRHPRRLAYPKHSSRLFVPFQLRNHAVASNQQFLTESVSMADSMPYDRVDFHAMSLTPTQPLPLTHIDIFSQHKLYPSIFWQENMSLVMACLSQGYVERARVILQGIIAQVENHNSHLSPNNSDKFLRLEEIIPPHTYREFFRGYLKLAIADISAGETTKWILHASNLLELLLSDSAYYGELENSSYAVWLKGLVSAKSSARKSNKEYSLLDITRVLVSKGAGLVSVLKDKIFEDGFSGGLGLVSANDVLNAIEDISRQENDVEVLETVMRARMQLQEEQETNEPIHDTEVMHTEDPLRNVTTLRQTQKEIRKKGSLNEDAEFVTPANLRMLLESLSPIHTERDKSDIIRQEIIEHTALEATKFQGLRDFEKMEEIGIAHEKFIRSKYMQELIHEWLDKMSKRIENDIVDSRKAFEKPEPIGGRFASLKVQKTHRDDKLAELMFTSIPPRVLAYLTISVAIQYTVGQTDGHGMKITRATKMIGEEIQTEYQSRFLRETLGREFDKRLIQARLADLSKSHKVARRAFHQEMFRYRRESGDLPQWTEAQQVKIGAKLLRILLDETFITRKAYSNGEVIAESKQPAFYHQFHYINGKKLGMLRGNEVIIEKFGVENMMQFLSPRQLPMVVEPLPWTAYNKGGYRNTENLVMRVSGGVEQLAALRLADTNHQLYAVYDSLNSLARTAWSINKRVFDVVAEVWNSGEKFLDIVPVCQSTSEEIIMPDYLKDNPSHPKYMVTYELLLKERSMKYRAQYSERCTTNYKLEIARAFIGEKFYFPQSLDFRGRAYPISNIFSHVGDDLCRGLLKFHEAKPLGRRGFDWLLAQIGTLQGLSKSSYAERIRFARDNMEKIYDSADKPLEGARWWAKAEDAWQCLAVCFEVADAMRSGNPEEYQCSLPVRMDGTCNGLQHYAALGGDYMGAAQVNLVPGDKPADVYSKISSMVSEMVDEDAKNEVPEAIKLKGYITRKVVKQPVMTTVYGVTFMGARDQILRQLEGFTPYSLSENSLLSIYLTRKVTDSIGNLFEGATKIQKWLSTIAAMVASSIQAKFIVETKLSGKRTADSIPWKDCLTTSMSWTSPLGLPVVQPYRAVSSSQIDTVLQSMYLQDPSSPGIVDRRSQASAFPPNFIHSLDASHMMMTATECGARGLTFASVHDSFWTHACDVDEMGDILRLQFSRLHKQDLLGNLYRETIIRFGDHLIPVKRSNKGQKTSKYFFQAGKIIVPAGRDSRGRCEREYLESVGFTMKRTHEIPTPAGFVRLADVLPVIPLRGEFDVDMVQSSPYFFS